MIFWSPYLPRLQEYKCSYSYLHYKVYQCSLVAVVIRTCLKYFTVGTLPVLLECTSNYECPIEGRIILFYRTVKMLSVFQCTVPTVSLLLSFK
jgi:hypothetical protein